MSCRVRKTSPRWLITTWSAVSRHCASRQPMHLHASRPCSEKVTHYRSTTGDVRPAPN